MHVSRKTYTTTMNLCIQINKLIIIFFKNVISVYYKFTTHNEIFITIHFLLRAFTHLLTYQ